VTPSSALHFITAQLRSISFMSLCLLYPFCLPCLLALSIVQNLHIGSALNTYDPSSDTPLHSITLHYTTPHQAGNVQNTGVDGQADILAQTITRNRRSKDSRRNTASLSLKGCTVRYGNELGMGDSAGWQRGEKDENRDWEKEQEEAERMAGHARKAAGGMDR
jgi:hypothetical protein